jgi:hypothetical protein
MADEPTGTDPIAAEPPAPDPGVASPPAEPPVSDPPAADPPIVDGGEPTEPTLGPVLSYLAEKGYDSSQFDNDDAALEALLGTVEQHHQSRQYIEAGQRYAPHAEEFDTWLAEKQKQQPAATTAEPPEDDKPPAFEWTPPEYDPTWESKGLVTTADGRWLPPEGRPDLAGVAQKLNAYYDWHTTKGQEIVRNFPQMVEQAVSGRLQSQEETFQARVNEAVQQGIAAYEQQQQSQRYVTEREAEFFQQDAQGRNVLDPENGAPVLTEKGQAFIDYATEAQGYGIQDPAAVQQYVDGQLSRDEAAGRFGAATPASDPQQATTTPVAADGNGNGQTPASTPAIARNKKGQFIRRVVEGQQRSQRGGSEPSVTDPDDMSQNPDASLSEMLKSEAQKAGIR